MFTKLHHKAVILLLICGITACGKKKNAQPQKQDEKPGKVQTVTESYNGTNSTYLLTYNTANQLQAYQNQNNTEKFDYTYEGKRINTITYQNNGKTYSMVLSYSDAGKVVSGFFTSAAGGNNPSVLNFTCTQEGDATLIKTYNDLFTLTVKNDNLVNAEFNAWYYKRKITFTYGTEPGILYGTNLYLPNEELKNPLLPQSQIMNVMVQMALQVFAKNNLVSVQSAMYNRTINYMKDANGNVINSFTKIDKLEEDATITSQKQITYTYK